jgi:hypothetical protein
MCRNGFLVGPSSGLALTGLLSFLEKRKATNSLDELRNKNGEIACKWGTRLSGTWAYLILFRRRFYLLRSAIPIH